MASRDQLFGQRANGFTGWSRGKPELDQRAGVQNWTVHDIRRSVATAWPTSASCRTSSSKS